MQHLLTRLRPGDTLVVWKLDRLGRSLKDLVTLVSLFQQQGVHFVSLQDHLDTTTAQGRRILVQLNRCEGRHCVARAVFHGKKGELRQRYREGMEDQLGALGLVVNAVVLWNTRYLQQALEEHQATAGAPEPGDVARL